MAVATPRAAPWPTAPRDALQRTEDLGRVGQRHTASSARGPGRSHAVPHPVTVSATTRQRGLVVSTDTTPPPTRTPRSWRCSRHRVGLAERPVRPVEHRCGVTGP
jgi:hypothetical protein